MAKKHVPFYAIGSSVGKFGANQNPDVLLIQFFLNEIGKHPDFSPTKPATPLPVNGQCGESTIQWILWFQNFLKSKGVSVVVDGRVDAMQSVQPDWPNMKNFMPTLGHLNFSFRKRFKARHNDLESDPGTPAALQATFKSADF